MLGGVSPTRRVVGGPTVARSALFWGVEDAAAAEMIGGLPQLSFLPGHVLFTEGDPVDRLFIIADGKVKIGARADDGRATILALMGPTDIVGELSILDAGPRTLRATAITAVSVVTMDRDQVRMQLSDHPESAEQLLRMLARRVRRSTRQVCDLIHIDAPARVAKELLVLAQRFGIPEDGAVRVNHDLTQEELAQLVGSSRETVNKVLGEFVHRGWIQVEGKSVLITNFERLAYRAR